MIEKRIDLQYLVGQYDAFIANFLVQCFHVGSSAALIVRKK